MATANDEMDFAPPPGPPPLLSKDDLVTIARQGYLPVTLSDSLKSDLDKLFEKLEAFYAQPLQLKKELYPEKHFTEFGYYHVEDEKEYVTLRRSSDQGGDPELETFAAKVWQQAGALLHRMLCDIARATELPPSVWDQMLDGTLTLPANETDMTATLLRLFKYFPGQGFAGKHTDLGLLTLCCGTAPGLQCLKNDEVEPCWVDAQGPVVLVGQTLRALSDGLIRPGVHQVVPNPKGRFSVVFALRHSFKHQIDLERFGGEGSVDPRKLWEQLKIGVVNVNARKDLRDKQRQIQEAMRAAQSKGQG